MYRAESDRLTEAGLQYSVDLAKFVYVKAQEMELGQ